MKKYLRFMTAAVLTFALVGMFALAGCSSSSTDEGSSAATESSEAESSEAASSEATEAVELQLFAANSLSEAMDAVQALAAYMAEFEAAHGTQARSS